MNPPASPPEAPPPPPSPRRPGPPRAVLVGLGVAVLAGVAVAAFFAGRSSTPAPPPAASPAPTADTAASFPGTLQALPPAPDKPKKMEVPGEPVHPSFWVDVYAPARVRQALAGNAWLQEQVRKPLGQGFLGGWAAMLGTRSEDLGASASFKGTVMDLLAGQLLSAPFRVVWFTGGNRTGTPAIIVPEPGNSVMAAFDGMNGAVHREVLEAATCPGGSAEVPAKGFSLARWLVAEQSLWAARTEDRMVFGRTAAVVLQGLCEPHLELEPPEKVDLELGFSPETFGREAQLLTHVMGMSQGIRLQFAAEGQRLVGRGITGPVVDEPRLDSASLSDELLRLVPEDTPVLLAFQLKLPERLDAASLGAFWSGKGGNQAVRTRQVALVWTPRGSLDLPTEVAILWGRPEDAAALDALFSGPNALERAPLCGQYVLASSPAELARLRKACEGQVPNLLHAAPSVVAGLREKGSVSFGLHTGALLGGLLADGYLSQEAPVSRPSTPSSSTPSSSTPSSSMPSKPGRPVPAEIEAARRDLETLPYLGLRGTVDGNRLVPGGFGS